MVRGRAKLVILVVMVGSFIQYGISCVRGGCIKILAHTQARAKE